MESIQLSDFYQSVTKWPSTEAEVIAIAEQVSQLVAVPFVAIHRGNGSGKNAYRLTGADLQFSGDAMDDFIRRKVQQIQSFFPSQMGPAPQVKRIQGLNEDAPWRGALVISHLAVVNISGVGRPELTGVRGTQGREDFGWLLVGAEKSLELHQELLLLAVAQRLAQLAEVNRFEESIQLRTQFLSIASHELKTPLTSIYGILQLQERLLRLKKDEPLVVQQERQESYLKMVIRQVQRLNELIDGLLDVSRIQNGRFMVEPSEVDVTQIVRETTSARLAVIAQEAVVQIKVESPESLKAWVDPVRMEEVVTNLVMNAIRFSPEGGVVWVRLRDDGGLLRLTVRDQGPCLPMEDRERIFRPFERAQRTSRFGGLGLGLFISRQIAQMHGGNVSLVESVQGKGNVFEASFPTRGARLMDVAATA